MSKSTSESNCEQSSEAIEQTEKEVPSSSGFDQSKLIEEFSNKYGEIDLVLIEPPPHNPWFTRPHALNYFYQGKLYRTSHERTSSRLELFLDLIYVGIVANMAKAAVEEHTGASLGKYILVFFPVWNIWAELKDFMNYYFSEDLLQRLLVVWVLCLLVVYDNNCLYADDLESTTALRACVVAYTLCRFTFALLLGFYSFFITEHRKQMYIYASSALVFSGCWYLILLIHSNAGRAIFISLMLFMEQAMFCATVHPRVKKLLKLEFSTALNIEHEDERLHSFFIIAIGEFLYSIVAGSPLAEGWNKRLAKGISLVIMAFLFLGIYSHKDGALKATHALRKSAERAIGLVYLHFIVIAALLLAGDAGSDLSEMEEVYLPTEEFGVLMYFHGGILVSLAALTGLALLDVDRTDPGIHYIPKWGRIGLRIPIGCLILGLTWAYEDLTLVQIMWLDTLFLILLYGWEFTVMNPWRLYCKLGAKQGSPLSPSTVTEI